MSIARYFPHDDLLQIWINAHPEIACGSTSFVDYIWRPVMASLIRFRDIADGTADIGIVTEANEVLDRRIANMSWGGES